jgi:hypothetical protein
MNEIPTWEKLQEEYSDDAWKLLVEYMRDDCSESTEWHVVLTKNFGDLCLMAMDMDHGDAMVIEVTDGGPRKTWLDSNMVNTIREVKGKP